MAAQFEIRQLRLDAARKILGMALGMCPKVGWPAAPLLHAARDTASAHLPVFAAPLGLLQPAAGFLF